MDERAFEKEKLCFEHNSAQMRALNEQMSKVPAISVTLTGGLWFAAAQAPNVETGIKFGILIFAGLANIGLALSCFRIRDVLQSYWDKIKEFSPSHFADGRPANAVLKKMSNYSMITIYVALMVAAALMSYVGAILFYWPFHYANAWAGIVLLVLTHAAFFGWLLKRSDNAGVSEHT